MTSTLQAESIVKTQTNRAHQEMKLFIKETNMFTSTRLHYLELHIACNAMFWIWIWIRQLKELQLFAFLRLVHCSYILFPFLLKRPHLFITSSSNISQDKFWNAFLRYWIAFRNVLRGILYKACFSQTIKCYSRDCRKEKTKQKLNLNQELNTPWGWKLKNL